MTTEVKNIESDNIDNNSLSIEEITESKPRGNARFCSCSPRVYMQDVLVECWTSSEIMFSNRLTVLLLCGPIALIGGKDGFNVFGESTCFALAGLALIPCAERLSFITEEVAAHTNETFGALLNATFGNAPELLISTAALRSGFYRVVQLTSLGSILTNLLLVFGVSSFIGGLRWQVQQVRLTSGNVSVGMLLISTTGLLLPAALKLSNEEMFTSQDHAEASLMFSRFNAVIMIFMYFSYLIFQLVTHKAEFDNSSNQLSSYNNIYMSTNAKNIWCNKYVDSNTLPTYTQNNSPVSGSDLGSELEMTVQQPNFTNSNNSSDQDISDSTSSEEDATSRESILLLPLVPKSHKTHHNHTTILDLPQSLSSNRRKLSSMSSPKIGKHKNTKKKNPLEKPSFLKRNKSDSDLFDTGEISANSSYHPSQGKP